MHDSSMSAKRPLDHALDLMTTDTTAPARGRSQNRLLWAIVLVLVGFGIALALGWPQEATRQVVAGSAHEAAGDAAHHAEHGPHAAPAVAPELWTVAPFALLLGAIAVFPLLPRIEHWWEHNTSRFYVAAGLGVLTLAYYALVHANYCPTVELHFPAHEVVDATDGAVQWEFVWAVFANGILGEFIPFIVLLFSLYTISGGIRIEGDLRAHPRTNTTFIAVGGLLASFIGTTGAAMLLIRPLLETNAERKHVRHTVVFFIFIVCNCGGCLLPIGDPPLFLGYLRGVPFTWTLNLWPQWLVVNAMLLAIYYLWDYFFAYRTESLRDKLVDIAEIRPLRIRGLGLNGVLLLGVVLSVALLAPNKILPGTDWHPWVYLREVVQLALVGLALFFGSSRIRKQNRFNYHAIVEVAVLFCGIFICMQPALQILNARGGELGIESPMQFFWFTGGLSSVLDNAPTYVVFFETAKTVSHDTGAASVAGVPEHFLVAISLGAVFMGAMTYIGNGPNFMVRAIAEKSGVRMPSFFGYVVYSGCILVPVFCVTLWLFS